MLLKYLSAGKLTGIFLPLITSLRLGNLGCPEHLIPKIRLCTRITLPLDYYLYKVLLSCWQGASLKIYELYS